MIIRRIFLAALLSVVSAFGVHAQERAIFGDDDQPGTRLHTNIATMVESGTPQSNAIVEAIQLSMTENDTTLTGEAKAAVAFDVDIANEFYEEMVAANSLIEVTKVLVENNPSKAVHVITLGAVLYPSFAQEVFDGAAISGAMNPDDVLVALLQAGADPTLVSSATAAGATAAGPVATIVPLGAGIGAGGTGGGDTTASTN
ncbi:MAG: hypothetical protein WA981_05665 [Glaciecola sp.]